MTSHVSILVEPRSGQGACALALALLASCTPLGSENPLIGSWRAELGPHATYEATAYEFKRNGSVFKLGSIATYPTPEDFSVVSFSSPAAEIVCGFEGEWHSEYASSLLIDTTCSDGRAHRISLELQWGPSQEAFSARLISVDGQRDWYPQDGMGSRWPWFFERCGPGDCLPSWDPP